MDVCVCVRGPNDDNDDVKEWEHTQGSTFHCSLTVCPQENIVKSSSSYVTTTFF